MYMELDTFFLKGCLQIPVASQWHVPISILLWEMAMGKMMILTYFDCWPSEFECFLRFFHILCMVAKYCEILQLLDDLHWFTTTTLTTGVSPQLLERSRSEPRDFLCERCAANLDWRSWICWRCFDIHNWGNCRRNSADFCLGFLIGH